MHQNKDGSAVENGEKGSLFLHEVESSDLDHGFPKAVGAIDSSKTDASVQELEILAEIQELQHKLWRLQSGVESNSAVDQPSESTSSKKRRLIVVSNRLPLSAVKDPETGELSFQMSSGGLVTALNGMKEEMSFLWVGWIGTPVPKEEQAAVLKRIKKKYGPNLLPVFLSEKIVDLYYNGFSNHVLWPLFHYQPLPSFREGAEKKFEMDMWHGYAEANKKFAKAITSAYKPGDLIWIHDYHLMLLPKLIRRTVPNCKIGWFLHIPFPSSEVFRTLPLRRELLEAVLSSDLVGFHTYDYARHFLSSCTRVLGLECTPKGLEFRRRFVTVGVFPIGIDPKHFESNLENPKTQKRIEQLRSMFKGQKVLLGVDRLDYIKGVPHKLLALERFFKKHPEWVGYVVLIQIGVPSRTSVGEYKILSAQVNELVGRINARYGTLNYTPIHYINRSVNIHELCALYNVADAAVVTSIRDGMNLVSYEYVVCQKMKPEGMSPGMLLLSEFTGSAQSLSGAIRINPWNTEQVANWIYEALTMGEVERELRHSKLYRYVTTHTASFWAKSFVSELIDASGLNEQRSSEIRGSTPEKSVRSISSLPIRSLLSAYRSSSKRLILITLEDTISPSEKMPMVNLPSSVKANLNSLAEDEKNIVYVMSSTTQQHLSTLLGNSKCGLAPEHGFFYRPPGLNVSGKQKTEWLTFDPDGPPDNKEWKLRVVPVLSYFTERTPGTVIENQDMSVAWHYQNADGDFGAWQAKDLQVHLEDVTSTLPVEVYQMKKRVEVRHVRAKKSKFAESLLTNLASEGIELDFILCIGSGRSDDSLFQVFMNLAASEATGNVKVFNFRMGLEKRTVPGIHMLDSISHARELLAIVADFGTKIAASENDIEPTSTLLLSQQRKLKKDSSKVTRD
mmetsp:Transcript_12010/g.15569  ORF Transcript_12010/g.15569 Transcript_12010/m.15569 type:complete len:903 (+) Transcript_12010:384-3092(+)